MLFKNNRWRALLILLVIAISLVTLAPTFYRDSLPTWWTNTFDPIALGLDLQGGMHLVLGVDVDKAVESRRDGIIDQLETLLQERDITFRRVERAGYDRLTVTVYDTVAAGQVDTLLREQFPALQPGDSVEQGGFIQRGYRLSATEADNIRDYAVRQALETMRNRVDQFGVSEPTLQRQSDNRILIQLPGIKDPQRAIDLIGKTARLEFKMVVEEANIQDALRGELPAGTQLLYERRTDRRTGVFSETPLVVQEKTVLTGDLLSDAQVRIDTRFNEP
jgi:preprotein translocase subunit SecD